MYRLLTLSALILVSLCEPRRPRIYNVLISTKKNLSPSQAIPVYEPVIRTTSLGVAFPPLIYHSTPIQQSLDTSNVQPLPLLHGGPVIQEIIKNPTTKLNQQPSPSAPANVQQLQPIEQYVPYNHLTSPFIQQYYRSSPEVLNQGENYNYPEPSGNLEEREEPQRNFGKYYENVNDPKHVIANLKKNSDIPDVPPPAIPVRTL